MTKTDTNYTNYHEGLIALENLVQICEIRVCLWSEFVSFVSA